MKKNLIHYVKQQRKLAGLNQEECAHKAGVSLTFIRKLEQGKGTLQMDKVNHVLKMFGAQLGVVPLEV